MSRLPYPYERPRLIIGDAHERPHETGCAYGAPSHKDARPNAVFKVHGGDHGGLPPASLKTEQRTRDARGVAVQARSTYLGLPRKEVIQPQLPLRLPCYDFTPITSPTFDGSLPKG